MKPFSENYIVPGDIFADETVLCMRCASKIMGLDYAEMPKHGQPSEIVRVPVKRKMGNYRQMNAVIKREGKQQIVQLPLCQECVKEVDPARDSDAIIGQIREALKIEARWIGASESVLEAIDHRFADAHLIRKLTVEEMTEGKILEEVA